MKAPVTSDEVLYVLREEDWLITRIEAWLKEGDINMQDTYLDKPAWALARKLAFKIMRDGI